MQFYAFYGEIRPVAVRRHGPIRSTPIRGEGCTRTGRSMTWECELQRHLKTGHIYRLDHGGANPPRIGLCNFVHFWAFFARATRCRDKSRNDRRECPRRLVHPEWRVPPSTMIERREEAVFDWRFVFSGLRG